MKYSIESLGQQVIEGNKNRRHFERTPTEMADAILDEAQELVKEMKTASVTDEIFPVVGEIGDLYILLAQLCDDLGISPADAMDFKIKRNEYKYPDHTMNNGYSKGEAFFLARRFYKDVIGGDERFSHAYLDYLADVPDHEEHENNTQSAQDHSQVESDNTDQQVIPGQNHQVIFPPQND